MTEKLYIDYIINAIKIILDNNLNTKLLALATEYGDGIELIVPIVYRYEVLPQDEVFIVITGTGSVIQQETSAWTLFNHQILLNLWVTDTGGNEELLSRKLYRQVRAIYEIIADNLKLGLSNTIVQIKELAYSPVYQSAQEQSFFQGASITLNVICEHEF